MTDDRRVDPRYDPAFQRGFDGTVTSRLRSRPVSAPPSDLVTPAPFRAAPKRDELREASEPASTDPVEAGFRPAEPGDASDAASGAQRRLSRNPFLIALVLLGSGLTLGGLGWANYARMLVSGRGVAATDLDYWFLQATVSGAPLTIIVGISILAGVLFVAASAWNRRP
jgi:hypothetical protein